MLYGNFVKLRYYEPEDLDFLITLRGTPESYQYFFEYEPLNKEMQKKWWENSFGKQNEKNFIVADINTNKAMGTIAIYDIDWRNNRAEFGRLYIKNNVVGSIESEFLLLEYAFKHLNLNKIYCISLENNISVIKQHKKFGFKDEGLLKEYVYHNGQYNNVYYQSLLKKDYFLIEHKLIALINNFKGK